MSPKIVNKTKRRKEIMIAAAAVWAREGLYNIKVEDVAIEAGIAKGSIYEYFEDNEDVVFSTLLYAVDDFYTFINVPENPEDDFKTAFYRVFSQSMIYCSHPKKAVFKKIFANSYSISGEKNPTAKKILAKIRLIYKSIYDRLYRLFKKARENGLLKVKDIDTVVDIIIAMERGYFVANHYEKKLTEEDINKMFSNIYFMLTGE